MYRPIPLVITLFLVAFSPAAEASSVWLGQADYGKVRIVSAPDASEGDRLAAAEFQRYWRLCTGHEAAPGPAPGPGFNVWIGPRGLPAHLLEQIRLEGLGPDGLCIRTVGPRDLVIAGGERGTLHGVYEFLERWMGVRWLTPQATHIPEKAPAALPMIDFRFEPVFEYRHTTYLHLDPGIGDFGRVHRWVPGPGFSAHTYFNFVPPAEYFPEHPEYFSEVNGKRIAPWDFDWGNPEGLGAGAESRGQLCMTNPEVLALIAEKISARIEANPEEKLHHVSQMDWGNWCQCARCAALDEAEESTMGSTLWGINAIAEAVEAKHPGHGIETLAYQYTRKPPKHLRPRANVAIKLCSIECDFGTPLGDPNSGLNRAFAEDIAAWAKISNRLHVWDYTTNFRNFQMPHPNLQVLQSNLQFFAVHGVKGMFEQGAPDHGAELAHLRSYLVSKLLWDPYADVAALTEEFLTLYYGAGAPFIEEYIVLVKETARRKNAVIGCFQEGSWIDRDLVVQGEALFARAFAAVDGEPWRERLDLAYLPIQYAALTCPPEITVEEGVFVASRPPSLSLEAYTARLREKGVERIVDFFPFDHFLAQIGGKTPARHIASPLEVLEDEHHLIWIAPELHGAVLRWRAKGQHAELLRGYTLYDVLPTQWREYRHGGPVGALAAGAFQVAARGPGYVDLEAVLENGLVVTKRLALEGDGGAVVFTLTFMNPTDGPLVPSVKSVPEFFTQTGAFPEIWTQAGGPWVRQNPQAAPSRLEMLALAPYTGLAAHFPEAGFTLLCRFRPEAARPLLYAYRAEGPHHQLNLDLLPDQAALAPGEMRSAQFSFTVSNLHPRELD